MGLSDIFDLQPLWRQEVTPDYVEWHHRLDGHGFGWTPGVGVEQGGLACCDSLRGVLVKTQNANDP